MAERMRCKHWDEYEKNILSEELSKDRPYWMSTSHSLEISRRYCKLGH